MNNKNNLEDIKKEVKSLISKIIQIQEEDIKENADFFKDLGIDSMMALEIIASIEKKYRITIPEEDIPKLTSLEKIYEYLDKSFK